MKSIKLKGAKTAQRRGDILDLVEEGRSIENLDIDENKKIEKVRKVALNYADHNRGNFTEPAWFYCYGYILYGMLKEKADKEGSYKKLWKIVLKLLSRKSFEAEKKQENQESMIMPIVRIFSTAISGTLAYLFLSFLNNNVANTENTVLEYVFINVTLLSLITIMGWLSGSLIAIFKGEKIEEKVMSTVDKIKKSKPATESKKILSIKNKWKNYTKLGFAKKKENITPIAIKDDQPATNKLSIVLPKIFKSKLASISSKKLISQSI